MATPGVGQDIEAVCGKCGGLVWHAVMAKVGDRIAKVVCKRCGGQHRYKTEAGPESAEGERRATPRASRSKTAEAAPPPLPAFDPSKPPRTYSPRESFTLGDRVAHPTFGVGVVAGSPGAGKVEVIFPSGPRVLACAKAISTLARPVAVSNQPIADRPPQPK